PPYHLLLTVASQTFERLQGTDIRTLNRQLKRTFDMIELSTMSNTIIESVMVDVD
ncbi:hypothetical protein CLU79DRAFT_683172, partial [Phycomyces nitens]